MSAQRHSKPAWLGLEYDLSVQIFWQLHLLKVSLNLTCLALKAPANAHFTIPFSCSHTLVLDAQ
ncbi:hypothetical protein DL89DRAFT_265020 [Linderina pennispora]|uniref:Uncharacterized protein n=1 Tax=Linderina pennispora TaxID=61395 RepID=A0A1Y1WI91_9FUNG|nr:uncharacterized protein DL89DRAFT_265020 [Linderina pennispora]ORX72834.1 hypothetical protein DL89DRAFT_265020 [Linderina pennispora]